MEQLVDPRLRREAAEYAFRFSCEDCMHFSAAQKLCAHRYPTEPHRGTDLSKKTCVVFCKEFELG